MNPIIYFIAFFIFLLCQVAMVFFGMFIADLSGANGYYYWSITLVIFLLVNELCFHRYDFELNFDEDEESDGYDWVEDDE